MKVKSPTQVVTAEVEPAAIALAVRNVLDRRCVRKAALPSSPVTY